MNVSSLDIVHRTGAFDALAPGERLRPWEWEFLHRADGTSTVGELAQRCGVEKDCAAEFVREAMNRGLLDVHTLSLDDYRAQGGLTALAAPAPVVAFNVSARPAALPPAPPRAPEPVPEPEPTKPGAISFSSDAFDWDDSALPAFDDEDDTLATPAAAATPPVAHAEHPAPPTVDAPFGVWHESHDPAAASTPPATPFASVAPPAEPPSIHGSASPSPTWWSTPGWAAAETGVAAAAAAGLAAEAQHAHDEPVAGTHDEHVPEAHDEHVAVAHDEPVAETHDEHVAETHDEPVAVTHDEPVAETHDEHVAVTHDEHVAETHDEHVAVTHDEPVAQTHDEHVAVTHDEPVAETHDEHVALMHDEPVAEVHEEHVAVAHDEPVAQTHDEFAAVAHDEPVAETHDGHVAVTHDEPVAEIHDEHVAVTHDEPEHAWGATVAAHDEPLHEAAPHDETAHEEPAHAWGSTVVSHTIDASDSHETVEPAEIHAWAPEAAHTEPEAVEIRTPESYDTPQTTHLWGERVIPAAAAEADPHENVVTWHDPSANGHATPEPSLLDPAGSISLSFSSDEPFDHEQSYEAPETHAPAAAEPAPAPHVAEPVAAAAPITIEHDEPDLHAAAAVHDTQTIDVPAHLAHENEGLAGAQAWKESLSWREQQELRDAEEAGREKDGVISSLLRALGVR